jgi:hypothetical protein
MELDAAGLPRLRLAEHSLHTWDIAAALEPAAQVSQDAVALLIDTLGQLAARAGQYEGTPVRLHVHTESPERDFSLQLGDGAELTPWSGGTADGELQMPAEAFLRLIYGRLDSDHAPHVELTGPISLDDLRRTFPGI